MSLKELTSDLHSEAERKTVAQLLASGEMSRELYTTYLYNQYTIYDALEQHVDIPSLEGIKRADNIRKDYMWHLSHNMCSNIKMMPSTQEYVNYVSNFQKNSPQTLAHVYVRHLGDMFGGSMIAKNIPGPNYYYKFENRGQLIKELRAMLDDSMADEARICFQYAIRLFEDLENEYLRQSS
jgi:heme oxygenase